ncbi:MAG: chain length determinant protein EpsF [Burkholderiaceae bacterium]|nr:chain length determinant protein EpsF [Burkholderiaceae bacterium]
MTLAQLLVTLRVRWWVAVLVLATTVLTTLVVSVQLPKRYTSVAQVIVDIKDPIGGGVLAAQAGSSYMATQIDIINSRKVALRVVDRLRLAENTTAVEQWRSSTDGGQGSIRHYYADLLLKYLEVKPSRESTVVSIGYSSGDPNFAATVANEFAQAYIDTNIELRVEPARQSASWFDEQTRQLRESLDRAQGRLSDYQRSKGIVSAEERLDVETLKLQELSSQATQLAAVAVESAKRRSLAKQALALGGAAELPDVVANPLVAQLKADQARMEGKLKEQGAILGANHPEILKLRQELESNRARLAREIETVANSLDKTAMVNTQREAEARAALERQRARVLQIKQAREELTVLQRDVENAQRAYDAVTQRLTQTNLESQAVQANILLLNRAEPSIEPSSPRIVLNVAISAFLGLLLGVAAAVALELANRRVRRPEDLLEVIRAPLLAEIGAVPTRMQRRQAWSKVAS